MKRSKVLPPTYFYLSLVLMLALFFLFPIMKIIPSPWNAIGVIFLLAGLYLALAGDRLFRQAGTTIQPFAPSTVLVTRGVFRFSRNPMYLGFALFLTGTAILLGALSPFVAIPVFVILIDRLFVTAEERMLKEKFGLEYLEYQLHVRRWL